MTKKALLVVNFGGPRNQHEISSFLQSLLTDKEIIRTPLPGFLQDLLFRRIAKKRAPVVAEDYAKIGGGSPIYADTEWMALQLGSKLNLQTITFHRYLESTHKEFLKAIHHLDAEEILVFPLFPQFSYATTGSIARWFLENVHPHVVRKMRWVKAYSKHKAYLRVFDQSIREFLSEKQIEEEELCLFFSAHGLPVSFITSGDVYQKECEDSFNALKAGFPRAESYLSYQSQFGRAKWLEPSTVNMVEKAKTFLGSKKAVFIPLSFTSDHIETLYEIEELYVEPLTESGFSAYRCPALGRKAEWVDAAFQIIEEGDYSSNAMLVR